MITFAGVPLCYEDASGEITRWIERFLPLEDLRDQTGPAALRSQRPASRSEYQPGVNLPLPNYPDPPRPKLSTLCWPSGAARWSRGYFLCTGSQLTQILASTTNNQSAQLVLTDQEADVAIAAPMYLLAARPMSAVSKGPDDSLYLLSLVDQRYFWQWIDSDALQITTSSQWADVFNQLETQLGAAMAQPAIPAAYGIPDPDELTRPYENAALLLDAAAFSVGQRVVADLEGTISLENAATSLSWTNANLADSAPLLMAGGQFTGSTPAAVYPAQIVVSFQKWREGAVDPGGDVWNVHVSAASLGYNTTAANLSKLIHSTAFADFTSKGGSPDNAGEVNALAQQIAADYLASIPPRFDVSIRSLFEWIPTGFDDHVEWTLGRLEGQHYQAHTRVQSLPSNFGVEEQLQQFADKPVYPSPTRFTLKANLLPTPNTVGSAAAVHRKWNTGSSSYQDTTDNLTVFDPQTAHPGVNGQSGFAAYKGDSLRWEIVELDARFLAATLLTDLAPGGTATATLAATGTTISVSNWPTSVSGSAGDQVYVRWDAAAQVWWTWPFQPSDDAIITTWPPFPPWEPGEPNPPDVGNDLALVFIQDDTAGNCNSLPSIGAAALLRGFPTTPFAITGGVPPGCTLGPTIQLNNFGHPVLLGELALACRFNGLVPGSQRYHLVRSQLGGHFMSKTGGVTWSKGTSSFMTVYLGPQGAEVATSMGASVFNKYGDIPPGKFVWIESTPLGWYVTSAEC